MQGICWTHKLLCLCTHCHLVNLILLIFLCFYLVYWIHSRVFLGPIPLHIPTIGIRAHLSLVWSNKYLQQISSHLIEREASLYGKEEVKDILVQQVGWVKALQGKDEKLEMMMGYVATHVH